MPQKFSKKELLSLIVHDLKTPIGINKWQTEMLLDGDYGPITEEQRKVFLEMEKGNNKTLRLIREFLHVSLIPESGAPLNIVDLVIGKVLSGVIEELHDNIVKQGQSLVGNYESELHMLADQDVLRIIFYNILSNAIKYAPKDGQITIDITQDDKEYIIGIANSGESIPLEEQAHLYERNARSDRAREIDPEGTGLGLYLMKSIVDDTGGRTWFTSIPGGDTTFFVAYPLSGMSRA